MTFVKQFMDENGGTPPPGINVYQEYEILSAGRRPRRGSPATQGEE